MPPREEEEGEDILFDSSELLFERTLSEEPIMAARSMGGTRLLTALLGVNGASAMPRVGLIDNDPP